MLWFREYFIEEEQALVGYLMVFIRFSFAFWLSYLDFLSVKNVWCCLVLITMVVLFSSVEIPFCMRLLDHS